MSVTLYGPNQKFVKDNDSTIGQTSAALRPPVLKVLPSQERNGALAYSNDILQFFNGPNGWSPIAVGSGSLVPALNGLENVGTAPGAQPFFVGYDFISSPGDKLAKLANIAPGPSGHITITPSGNGSILIDLIGATVYTLTDGGTGAGHASLVSTSSGGNTLKTVGLDVGPGISLSTTGTDITISNTTIFSNGGVTPGNIPLVASTSLPGAFTIVGVDAGTGVTLTTTGTDVTANNTIALTDGGVIIGHSSLVSSTTVPGNLQTVGLDAGSGISLATNGTDVTIADITSLANGGIFPGGTSLVASGVAPTLETKGLVAAGTNIAITSTATDVTFTVDTDYCFIFFELITPTLGSAYSGMILTQMTYRQKVTNTTTPTVPAIVTWNSTIGPSSTSVGVTVDNNTVLYAFCVEEVAVFAPLFVSFTWGTRQQQNTNSDIQLPQFLLWPAVIATHSITEGIDPRILSSMANTTFTLASVTANTSTYNFAPVTVWSSDFRLVMFFV